MFKAFTGSTLSYEMLWKTIVRPERMRYELYQLGSRYFKMKGIQFKRKDLCLANKRKLRLHCSHFQPIKRPC